MSFNELQDFDDEAFDECCRNVTVLDLSHNKINDLKPRHFERLRNLEVLYLESNEISNLDPETFRSLEYFEQLDLSGNPIELESSPTKGFLVQSTLRVLNLDECSIRELPAETFINMTQLLNLTLSGNPIDKSLDTTAFDPLKGLIRLRISNLTQDTTRTLCEKLESIDNINFDGFNLSCTLLIGGETWEGSIAPDEVEPKAVMSPPLTTRKTTAAPPTTTSSIPPTELPTAPPETTTSEPQETSDATFEDKMKLKTTTVDIDNETIKFILVGESRCFIAEFDVDACRFSSVA